MKRSISNIRNGLLTHSLHLGGGTLRHSFLCEHNVIVRHRRLLRNSQPRPLVGTHVAPTGAAGYKKQRTSNSWNEEPKGAISPCWGTLGVVRLLQHVQSPLACGFECAAMSFSTHILLLHKNVHISGDGMFSCCRFAPVVKFLPHVRACIQRLYTVPACVHRLTIASLCTTHTASGNSASTSIWVHACAQIYGMP